jgi:hypothetical protein
MGGAAGRRGAGGGTVSARGSEAMA